MRLVLALTGASGAVYGLRTLDALTALGHEVHLVPSRAFETVLRHETGKSLVELREKAAAIYREEDTSAPPASGSFQHDGMAVVPCSLKTLAAIAHGYADNLVTRAAMTCLKERRRLVLVTRETPLDLITIRNMEAVTEAGGTILPASPGFYHQPKDVGELVDHVVGKTLDQLNVPHDLFARWRGLPEPPG